MSKFIDKIKAEFTGKRFIKNEPLQVEVKCIETETEDAIDLLNEYVIGVTYSRLVKCLPKDLDRMIENVVRELKEAVYGEFRNQINELERQFAARDYYEAEATMREIIREVGA